MPNTRFPFIVLVGPVLSACDCAVVPSIPDWITSISAELLGGALAALAGAGFGFWLSQYAATRDRKKRMEAHWGALKAEIQFCSHLAKTYVTDEVAAPLYRLPTAAYSNSFPALLADADVENSEVHALIQFFNEVATLNRGLDLVQQVRERTGDVTEQLTDHDPEVGLSPAAQKEYERNLRKARRLIPPPTGDSAKNYFEPAWKVVTTRLPTEHRLIAAKVER